MPYRQYRLWRMFFLWPWSAISYAILIVLLVAQAVLWLTYDPRQPVHFERVEVLNSPIKPGGVLEARVYRDKVRDDCTVQATRHAINQDGVAFELARYNPAPGEVGTPYLDVRYSTPIDIPEGLYTLRIRVVYECPRNLDFEFVQPLVQFRVQTNPDVILGLPMGVLPSSLIAPSVP